jgi:predicted RNA polymerase sigma factor
VALTLRAVAGLSTAQIARAFLVPEATMAQRIVRAKARLGQAGARFTLPSAEELPGRVAAVAHVLYLIFTEGHTASTGRGLTDLSLADEAIHLTRQLHRHLPAAGEVTGLLALMLLTDARRAARTRPDGSLVPLADQDRSLWDRAAIAEGVRLLEATLPTGPVGPYQLQAAIAAVHAEETTDWPTIAGLYGRLARVAPSPIVELNRAVAVAMASDADRGLGLIAQIEGLDDYHLLHAARADLLRRLGRHEEAAGAYRRALALAPNPVERAFLERRLSEVG